MPSPGGGGGGGGIEKRPGTEKRCSHNLQSVHLGQRDIFERALFVITGLLSGVSNVKKMAISVKTMCLLALLLVLLS